MPRHWTHIFIGPFQNSLYIQISGSFPLPVYISTSSFFEAIPDVAKGWKPHEPPLEPDPAEKHVDQHERAVVNHPGGKVDGGGLGKVGEDGLEDEVGPRAGHGTRAARVGRVGDREQHHDSDLRFLLGLI